MPHLRRAIFGMLVLALITAGCSSGGAQTQVPSGWESADGRWWQADVDTAMAFRNLESLEAMGVTSQEYVASLEGANRDQFTRAVKQELLPLYRNRPEVIDSLFQELVAPMVEDASLSGDTEELRKTVTQYKNKGYKAISDNFREPRTKLTLGKDVPVSYPDSLRNPDTSGRVEMQVYLNDSGEPQAVELLERVHPTLNDIAMNAATRMRWEPAYLLVDGEWVPQPAWVYFTVNFRIPGA